MTVATAIQQGTRLLEDARIAAPRLTAEVLLCHALRRERSYLYAHPEQELTEVAWVHYGRYLHERLGGKPTQYITHTQEFYGRPFHVTPEVLIPRPETEHVVETALRLAPGATDVVDVGCGSGAIAVTLRLEGLRRTWASDISPAALRVAADNARRLGADVNFVACDLLSAFRDESFDLVVCNPPYVPETDRSSLQREVRDFEPPVALFGGESGVEVYRRLMPEAVRVLRPGGWLIVELGYQGLDAVRGMLDDRWRDVEVVSDLAGLPRVLAAGLRID